MKNKLIILGIVGFALSVTTTVYLLVNESIAGMIKTNIVDSLQVNIPENIGTSLSDTNSSLEDDPNSQHALFTKALLLAYKENDEEAKTNFKQALETSGEIDKEKIQNFLDAYTNFESSQNAPRIYLDALLTKACIDAEKYEFAKKLATKILEQKSDYRDVWILLGYANLKLEAYKDAEDAFIKAKSIDSVKPEIHYFLGLSKYMQDNWQGASDEFELGILYGFEPKNEAYKKLAESKAKMGAFEEALEAYEYLLSIDQNSVTLFKEPILIAINNLQDFDRALTLANTANTMFPNEPLGWTLTAEVYLAQKDLSNAESAINTAIDTNPFFAEAYYVKGLIKEAQNDIEVAKTSYKKAYETSKPGDEINTKSAQRYNALVTK